MNDGARSLNCDEFSEALSAYLDGELSAEERSRLEAHLEGCPRCRQELKSLRAVSSLVTSLPQVTPSPAFLSALGRGVEKRRRWLRPIPLFKGDLIPALAAAAVILISVTMLLVIPSVTPLRRPAEPYPAAPQAAPSPGTAESPAPSRPEAATAVPAAPAGGAAVETKGGDQGRLRLSPASPTERGVMELAEKKAGPPAPAAPPYRDQERQQSVLAGHKDGGGGTARDELAATLAPFSGAPAAKAGETASAPAGPASNVGVAPGSGGEAWRESGAPGSPTAGKEAAAKEAVPAAAAKEAPPAQQQMGFAAGQVSQGPAFLLVTLRCTENEAGGKAFAAALDEFGRLRSPIPDLATVRPMSPEEERRCAQVLRELHESPPADLVAFRELIVPAADTDLVQAVFSDRPGVTFADAATDTARLRGVVSARRAEVAARRPDSGARAPEAAPSAEALGRTVLRTKAEPPAAQLVDVVVVLRGQPVKPTPSPK